MYAVLVGLHNLLRWVVLVMAVVVLVRSYRGWLSQREWTDRDRKWGVFFTSAMDTQLLLGLLLYF